MKQCFVERNFKPEAQAMIVTINRILRDYEAQGYDLSVRQLYYQLVARNIVENTERSYKNVSALVSHARLAGLIDWEMIKDRAREMVQNSHWNTPAEIVRSAARSYRVDMWENQPCYVEVMVEKQALEGVLVPVCRELDVPFTANKGYSSSSTMYEAAQRYIERAEQGKHLFVLYLGDHDPSGIDMSRDVQDRLELFTTQAGIEVERLALNMDQVREMRPPENPAKITDSRARAYIKRFGQSSWELDAIEPARLASLVRNAVHRLIDDEIWEDDSARMKAGRTELEKFADNYEGGDE